MKTWDVIIVGGGIIGLSLAIALRKRGATVLVVERREPGREASHAAGGMLVDCPIETLPALQPLARASTRMYAEFARELEVESGMKADLREYGTIFFPSEDHSHDPALKLLRRAKIEEIDPAIEKPPGPAYFLNERCVEPRALTMAALRTAKKRGVDFSSGDPVTAVNLSDGHVSGVTTTKTAFASEKVVNCAGAWSCQIGPYAFPTRPVKGQMLYLAMPTRTLMKHVIRSPQVYLIPRSDGRLLVGTTVEEAGYDKRTEAATIQRLYHAAIEVVPKLADAKILEDWAGLRPGTPDALPILGATATPGYYVATGHYRDGIMLAPVTAKVMSDVIEARKPEFDLEPFSASRFHDAKIHSRVGS